VQRSVAPKITFGTSAEAAQLGMSRRVEDPQVDRDATYHAVLLAADVTLMQ
jgi:hypothetical protein